MSDAISVLIDRKSLLSEDSLLERVIVAALQYYGARHLCLDGEFEFGLRSYNVSFSGGAVVLSDIIVNGIVFNPPTSHKNEKLRLMPRPLATASAQADRRASFNQ